MKAAVKKLVWPLVGVLALAGAWAIWRGRPDPVRYTTGSVDRGDVVEVVGATGTLEAVTTVQLGSQVSGTIESLHADFNSTVKKGQVVARLDPSLFQARRGQAEANLLAAKANVDRAKATVEDMRQKYERARELAAQKLLPQSDLETAKANYDGAVAQLKAAEAAQSQAQANLNQADVDLSHTIITTPIDGVVISRNVDVGQTVAASFQAPILFLIANDLTRMRVNASIDEADVGRVHEGQEVTFHVDAFPEREFVGTVEQVRLNPTAVQNVVTYNPIVAVNNDDLLLRPGMTATVSVIVRKAEDALRVPAAALRFRPEGFTRQGASGQRAATGQRGAGGVAMANSDRQRRGSGSDRPGRPTTVFVLDPATGQPKPVEVRVGISDGQHVEVLEGLEEGAVVVTGTEIPGARSAGSPRPGSSPSSNPFNPQFQRRQR